VEAGDRFGATIVVGNFDADSNVDFAVSAPAEVAGGISGGAVSIHRGQAGVAGVSTLQSSDGIWTGASNGDEFGYALASGDVDADGRDELIIGAPGASSGNGKAYVLEKDSSSWANTQTLTQTSTRFGSAVAVGDYISDSVKDIAIGAPNHTSNSGAIFTYSGSTSTVTFRQTLTQNETDRFGEAIAIGDVVGGSKGDLIVGMPGEDFDPGPAEGEVAIYGGSTTTSVGSLSHIHQGNFFDGGASDVVLPPEHRGADNFGGALIVYNQYTGGLTWKAGIVVGAPSDTVDSATSGATFVYFGTQADRKLDQVTMRHADALPYF
jgi:hypothetical protein